MMVRVKETNEAQMDVKINPSKEGVTLVFPQITANSSLTGTNIDQGFYYQVSRLWSGWLQEPCLKVDLGEYSLRICRMVQCKNRNYKVFSLDSSGTTHR